MNRYLVPLLLTTLLVACDGGGEDGAPGTSRDGDTDATVGTKPDALPAFADLDLYADDAPVNAPIPAGAPLDPESADYVAKIAEIAADPDTPPVLAYGQYSSTVFTADTDTPRRDVHLTCGGPWGLGVDTLADVPIPDYAEAAWDADGADNPVPTGGCGENADQDNHLIILDLANRCEYDLWQARKENGRWVASWANAIPLDSSGIYAHGLSTRGSGFAFAGGLVWPDELNTGEIRHALVMSYPLTRAGGPVPPASESDGWSSDPAALPEGARLRLDPTLDLGSLPLTPVERALARAMQTYGIYLVDDGGNPQLYAVDPASVSRFPYDHLDLAEDYERLDGIPWDKLQVLQLPSQDPDFQDHLALPDDGCATFR